MARRGKFGQSQARPFCWTAIFCMLSSSSSCTRAPEKPSISADPFRTNWTHFCISWKQNRSLEADIIRFVQRSRNIVLVALAALLLAVIAYSQNPDELPSAPSAVIQQKAQPAQQAPSPSPPAEASSAATTPDQGTDGKQEASDAATTGVGVKEKPKSGSEESPTIVRTVNEVSVVFTVTDKHNHYVKDLGKGDFKVVDDEKPVEEIRSFRRETELPLRVGLLIDASNSIRDRFKFEQESAIEFLNDTVRRRYDQAFIIGFDDKPELTQDFTDKTESLAHGVRELHPGGGTALYDALYFACRDKLLKASKSTTVRRAIILLSVGDDNQSHVTREEAIEMAQRAEAIVYTISTNVSGTKGAGDKVLERIADATGGRAFFPFQIRDVANAFAEIQDELRSQYAVSYKPADLKADGHYRTIEIEANDRKNFR